MHQIQKKLLELSKRENLGILSYREMAKEIGLPDEPAQKMKHHLNQLQRKGFLNVDKVKGFMDRTEDNSSYSNGILKSSQLLSIPIVGTANCGPANIFATENYQGYLKVSCKLLGRSSSKGLFCLRTDGSSMNRASVSGKVIESGDIVIVDSNYKNPVDGDVVLTVIESKATIKRFIDDRKHGQIILKSDSSYDYEPIYLHPEDDFQIGGKIINVMKK